LPKRNPMTKYQTKKSWSANLDPADLLG